ncbi:MAG: ATP-binding protein, partial [Acidimicrobiia bacterium]
ALDVPSAQPQSLDPLQRSEQEDEIGNWLEEHDVEDWFELASALVADGFGVAQLEMATKDLKPETTRDFARWLGLRCLAAQLLEEARIAVGRISELVRVVKNYSFLDQAPIQEIDPTEGINDTLILLKHKLRGVDVVLDFEPDLPHIEASGRDLNQVWTNLFDNAADAMDGHGTLSISASGDENRVVIRVADTGPGMDEATRERAFDPFFTTKEPGKGTGLGLHTVHTIVNRANGTIEIESSPAGTTFTLTFPRVGARLEE